MSRSTSTKKIAYPGVLADAISMVDISIKNQKSGKGSSGDATSIRTFLGTPSNSYMPGHTLVSSVSPLSDISQTRSRVGKIAKEGSSLIHHKTIVKPKTKTFRERDTFIQWLASLPEKFAPTQSQHRSNPTRRLVNPGCPAPSVETQRIKHFLSSLPEEVTEFDDAAESFDDFGDTTMLFKPFNRSRTMPVFANVRPSNSQEDLRSSSYLLDEENDEDQFADVGSSRLVHYASDGDLNWTSAVSKEVLDIMKRIL